MKSYTPFNTSSQRCCMCQMFDTTRLWYYIDNDGPMCPECYEQHIKYTEKLKKIIDDYYHLLSQLPPPKGRGL